MNIKKGFIIGSAGLIVLSSFLVACGNSQKLSVNSPTTTGPTVNTQQQDNKNGNGAPSTGSGSSKPTSQNSPPSTNGNNQTSQSAGEMSGNNTPPSGEPLNNGADNTPNRQEIDHVVGTLMQNPQVDKIVHADKYKNKQIGFQFKSNMPQDGVWEVEITVDGTPVGQAKVRASDYAVLSITQN